jgi:uncharacterized protein
MEMIFIQSKWVDQISILEISPEISEPSPLVFFVHGVASDKRQGIPPGYEMARKGFIFVSLDTILRGERNDHKFDSAVGGDFESIYPEETWLDGFITMLRMIRQTELDLQTLIEHYQNDPRVDPKRIGLAGYSMGGWATFFNMVVNPDIKAAAAIGATPDFEKRWKDVVLESSTYPEWSENIRKNHSGTQLRTDYIREMDPITYLLEDPIPPLLMICGELDRGPKLSCLDLFGRIKHKYQDYTDHLRLSVYAGIGHELTLKMAEETADWFRRVFD